MNTNFLCSFGSSVSIVSDYRLDDWATGGWVTRVRSLVEAKDFSSGLCVPTSFEAYPASYPMGTRGPFLGVKAHPGPEKLTTHPI
jgi:hypothetical protein